MTTYTAYKITATEELSHKAHLNNVDEVNGWLWDNKFANVRIVQDQTGKVKIGMLTSDDNWNDTYDWKVVQP